MMQAMIPRFPWPWLPIMGLMIFFAFFIVLLVRVSMKSRRQIFTQAETLPLFDGEKHER